MNKTHNHILLSIKSSRKIINADGTKYPVVRETAVEAGFQLSDSFFTFYWTDQALSSKEIRDLPTQVKVNHFPDITNLSRKNKLAQALNAMQRHFPKDYDFFPETFLLPMDYSNILKKHSREKYYIIKPENGCQGKGIFLLNNPMKLQKSASVVVQRYITNPLLIDGLKFDLRIYVLITCVAPLRVYMYKDGLARFATQKFESPNSENMDNLYQHLTNYAINKGHETFTVDSKDYSSGHKRLISSLFSAEVLEGIHSSISDLVIKSIISVLPSLQNSMNLCKKSDPNSCFQLLGYDVLMTSTGKFKLLQINQNPSLMTDTPVDKALKKQLLRSLFEMLEVPILSRDEREESKIKIKDRQEMSNSGQFKRIYPCSSLEETEQYDVFLQKSQDLFRDKFGIGVGRSSKKQQGPKEQAEHVPWNQSSQFYSKQKLQKVYGSSRAKTSHRKRLLFY